MAAAPADSWPPTLACSSPRLIQQSINLIPAAYPRTNASVQAIKRSFQQLGSLPCQSVCVWSSGSNQWTSLGNRLRGVVNQVELFVSNLKELVVVGRFKLNSTIGDVLIAHWGFDDQQKYCVGKGNQSTIPGPVRSVAAGGKGDLENYYGIRFGRVLYDGTNWYLYILSVDLTGKNGIISMAISIAGGFRSAVRFKFPENSYNPSFIK
ncbi:hypothetical protein BY996DRAFT_6411828 [Phakopsora pachyrhizi]|nr:hypothetical protein BY996DRAFT_6411828 [Phakopsora pachyrhizi]